MEPTTDQYLRGRYRDDKYELNKVSRLIDEVGPVFGRCFDPTKHGWPYELQRDAPWELKSYSYSTNAMILSSLALFSGQLRQSVLVPMIMPRMGARFLTELATAIEIAWKKFITESGTSPKTKSSSFGENDPFTLTWSLELTQAAALSTNPGFSAGLRTVAEDQVKKAFADPVNPVLARTLNRTDIPEHAFPLVRVILLAKALQQDLSGEANVRRHLASRLYEQLSASEVRDSNFDPAELVFALEGILQIDRGAVDSALLDRAFGVLSGNQKRTPFWRPTKPFVSSPQGSAILPLGVEVANSLLRICALLDTKDGRASRFTRHVELFHRYADWVFARVVRGKAKNPVTKSDVEFVGWHSEHVDLPGRIHLWQTSQVLTFLLNYEVMLQRHIGSRALQEVGLSVEYKFTRSRMEKEAELRLKGKLTAPTLTATGFWQEEGDTKEPLSGLANADSRYRVYGQVRKRFVEPRDSAASPAWSMLLYGPPGTGKTGIAEALAGALGYPLVTVTPSDFIRRGEAEVEARAQDIFDALAEQTDMVVLLDEIDRLILDRDSKDYRGQGDIFQLMTPSMLPKLKRLRELERVIVVVGTNYADRIDPAAKRPGRIDQQFLVLPPDLKQRNGIIRFLLKRETKAIWGESHALYTLAKTVAGVDVDSLAKTTALFVFTELVQWIRGVVQKLSSGSIVDKPTLLKSLGDGLADLPAGTVRLLSYDSRFRHSQEGLPNKSAEQKDRDFSAAQEPFDEFLLLLYLKLEAGLSIKPEEKKLAKRVVGRFVNHKRLEDLKAGGAGAPPAKNEVKAALQTEVKESEVVQLLLSRVADWVP